MIISGYASRSETKDLSGDRIMRGAFSRALKSLSASTQPLPMLYQHNPGDVIGIWTTLQETPHGLFCAGEVFEALPLGRDTLIRIAKGGVKGLSIGYKTRRSKLNTTLKTRDIYDLDLWEISIVTFPMCTNAQISDLRPEQPSAHKQPVSSRELTEYLKTLI